MSRLPTRIGPYKLLNTIGEGGFSIVKLAYDEVNRKTYACKIMVRSQLDTVTNLRNFEREIRLQQQLHHVRVIELVDILKDHDYFYIILEYAAHGDLFEYIDTRSNLSEHQAKRVFMQIVDGIEYIHSQCVCHRDLKPENILLDEFDNVKISDFGLSKIIEENTLTSTPCGSPCYMSPESLSGKPYDGMASDIWSLGVILFAMLTGRLPWTHRKNQKLLFQQIREGDYKIPLNLSSACRDLIYCMMCTDPSKRISIDEIRSHPWVNNYQYNMVKPTDYNHPVLSLRKIDRFFNRDKSFGITDAKSSLQRSASNTESSIATVIKALHHRENEAPRADKGPRNIPLPPKPRKKFNKNVNRMRICLDSPPSQLNLMNSKEKFGRHMRVKSLMDENEIK